MSTAPSPEEFRERFPALSKELREEDTEDFLRLCTTRTLDRGAVLVHEGEVSHTLFLVQFGRFHVEVSINGGSIEVGHLLAGTIVAELSFIDGGPSSATITASETSTVLAMDRATLDTLIDSNPSLTTALLSGVCQTLAMRIRKATDRFDKLAPGEVIEHQRHTLLERMRYLFGLHTGVES